MNPLVVTPEDLNIPNLGPREIVSPGTTRDFPEEGTFWHSEGDRILLNDHLGSVQDAMRSDVDPPSIELAGPRREIYFNPADTCVAIVTCGGLCPGINDVIRAIVMQAYYSTPHSGTNRLN
jgi:6-phosphofructokinase 1